MKKLIMIAIVLVSSSQLFAQNNNDKYQYSKEGLSQNDINIREAYIKSAMAEEAKKMEAQPIKDEIAIKVQIEVPVNKEGPDGVGETTKTPKNTPTTVTSNVAVPQTQVETPKKVAPAASPKTEELIIDKSSSTGYRIK